MFCHFNSEGWSNSNNWMLKSFSYKIKLTSLQSKKCTWKVCKYLIVQESISLVHMKKLLVVAKDYGVATSMKQGMYDVSVIQNRCDVTMLILVVKSARNLYCEWLCKSHLTFSGYRHISLNSLETHWFCLGELRMDSSSHSLIFPWPLKINTGLGLHGSLMKLTERCFPSRHQGYHRNKLL